MTPKPKKKELQLVIDLIDKNTERLIGIYVSTPELLSLKNQILQENSYWRERFIKLLTNPDKME